jgi:hypothetical protein
MWVTAVEVPDEAGPRSDRAFIERNAIALLSQVGRLVDPASKLWLGRSSPHPAIGRSGLWNVNYVDEPDYHPQFLEVFDYYARVTAGKVARVRDSIAPIGWWDRNIPVGQSKFEWKDPDTKHK